MTEPHEIEEAALRKRLRWPLYILLFVAAWLVGYPDWAVKAFAIVCGAAASACLQRPVNADPASWNWFNREVPTYRRQWASYVAWTQSTPLKLQRALAGLGMGLVLLVFAIISAVAH